MGTTDLFTMCGWFATRFCFWEPYNFEKKGTVCNFLMPCHNFSEGFPMALCPFVTIIFTVCGVTNHDYMWSLVCVAGVDNGNAYEQVDIALSLLGHCTEYPEIFQCQNDRSKGAYSAHSRAHRIRDPLENSLHGNIFLFNLWHYLTQILRNFF